MVGSKSDFYTSAEATWNDSERQIVSRTCPHCGSEMAYTATSCKNCGSIVSNDYTDVKSGGITFANGTSTKSPFFKIYLIFFILSILAGIALIVISNGAGLLLSVFFFGIALFILPGILHSVRDGNIIGHIRRNGKILDAKVVDIVTAEVKKRIVEDTPRNPHDADPSFSKTTVIESDLFVQRFTLIVSSGASLYKAYMYYYKGEAKFNIGDSLKIMTDGVYFILA